MTEEVPVLPLRGVLVFPSSLVSIEVGREGSIAAVTAARNGDGRLVLVSQRDPRTDDPGPRDIFRVGCLVDIRRVEAGEGSTVRLTAEGVSRARLVRVRRLEGQLRAVIEVVAEADAEDDPAVEAGARAVLRLYEQYLRSLRRPRRGIEPLRHASASAIADAVASRLDVKLEERQQVLETFDVARRLEKVSELVGRQLEIAGIERRITGRVRKQVLESQREYYLREQLRAIQAELGEESGQGSETEKLRRRVEEAGMSAEATTRVLDEVKRLERTPAMSAESVVLRNWLEWVLALPWSRRTEDRLDLGEARRLLDSEHEGLERAKERVLEHLAVRSLTPHHPGPILCLVGPPGVGKTSLARSVAQAMGRRFTRISLGGVRDEAEIRGHRRTYVGALPGRIVQGMRRAGSINPVFLLDEVDKIATDGHGDPAAALLEVLDPEENRHFSDHYLEIDLDLSEVLFITTANSTQPIPRALFDRMEPIVLGGYAEEEKLEIARRHLLPRLLEKTGLEASALQVSDGAIRTIIRRYTHEAGVRSLERSLATLCRKAARAKLEGRRLPLTVTGRTLAAQLGPPGRAPGTREGAHQVGVATAVYWTELGGDTMPIEVTVMAGRGRLLLTGQLGEVMRESAQAGVSYIRAHTQALGVPPDFHRRTDIHVHVPDGATPKEGPSAGITMATAMVSALSQRPVRSDVAMTGEITLRGRVLPVGGIREKVLAVHRAGIRTMVLPAANRGDERDLPAAVRRAMSLHFVRTMDEVLEIALVAADDAGARLV